jgi:hypothetical protein
MEEQGQSLCEDVRYGLRPVCHNTGRHYHLQPTACHLGERHRDPHLGPRKVAEHLKNCTAIEWGVRIAVVSQEAA